MRALCENPSERRKLYMLKGNRGGEGRQAPELCQIQCWGKIEELEMKHMKGCGN